VSRLSGVELSNEVREALELHAYCVADAVDYLLKDAVGLARSGLWGAGGTGARIFGESAVSRAVTGRSPVRCYTCSLAQSLKMFSGRRLRRDWQIFSRSYKTKICPTRRGRI